MEDGNRIAQLEAELLASQSAVSVALAYLREDRTLAAERVLREASSSYIKASA
ncbi:hypothetical protein [Frankia sp. Cj3]|uniref:hypothetical protein n=1 Tax=Frankia sp. Cj3 TaxID=2880976 RepID=UPI001EF5DECC|nr:hypothetical protein [Frankia sp. Cj3]